MRYLVVKKSFRQFKKRIRFRDLSGQRAALERAWSWKNSKNEKGGFGEYIWAREPFLRSLPQATRLLTYKTGELRALYKEGAQQNLAKNSSAAPGLGQCGMASRIYGFRQVKNKQTRPRNFRGF